MPDILEVLWVLIRYGVAVGVGVIIGNLFTRGKTKKGRTIPVIERTTKTFTLTTVLLLVVSLVAVVNTAYNANKQATCNSEFRRVIKERSDITVQDGTLRDRLDVLSNKEEAALLPLVQNLVNGSPNEVVLSSVNDLRVVIDSNVKERVNIAEQQRAIAEQRAKNPYPDPRC